MEHRIHLPTLLKVVALLLSEALGESTTSVTPPTVHHFLETTLTTARHQPTTTAKQQVHAMALPALSSIPPEQIGSYVGVQTSGTSGGLLPTFTTEAFFTTPSPQAVSPQYNTSYTSSPTVSTTQPTIRQEPIDSLPVDITLIEEKQLGPGGPNQVESASIQRALTWLRERRLPDFSWGNDTHMVILAKELSGAKDPSESDNPIQAVSDLENLLSIKQMDIEVLTMLDRHHATAKLLNTDHIAKYILAMGGLCKDARHFYGHDLVAALEHHEHDQGQEYEFALTALAICSSATHVRKRQIRRLLDIASGEVNDVDTIAMVLLALRCIVTDHRHRHLQHFVRRPARGLASLQGLQGSFGSLRSTALAMQALQDLEPDPAGKWNRTAASEWLLAKQRTDGSWTEEPLQDGQDPTIGIGLTADIVLALGWRGLGAVRALQCDHVMRESNEPSENGEPKLAAPVGLGISPVEETEPRNVSYTYTLWVGTNETEEYYLDLTSPKNTTFFRAMKQAAEIDTRFSFEAREWPNGHYVHTLAGMKEEPKSYHFWLLYRLPERPDTKNPPGNQLIAPLGVDELLVEDGEHYLYWYKKL
ncbi:AGAP004726-PA-like protein [Anopheles sinensis]|uniref:AGAP004726-PA-like protein n=1 Tax=Anopheles sinensis TaxID=74873 RepID=A0A084VZV3_ANOSI|nr:AGAP004726-PA-like protein [Anopheles sinensis]